METEVHLWFLSVFRLNDVKRQFSNNLVLKDFTRDNFNWLTLICLSLFAVTAMDAKSGGK